MATKIRFRNTSLVVINIGDKVLYKSKSVVGTVKAIRIVPNGTVSTDRSLVAVLLVSYDNTNGEIIATSDKFEAIPDEIYEKEYPSDLFTLGEKNDL